MDYRAEFLATFHEEPTPGALETFIAERKRITAFEQLAYRRALDDVRREIEDWLKVCREAGAAFSSRLAVENLERRLDKLGQGS